MSAATLSRPAAAPAVEPLALAPRDAAKLLGISERHLFDQTAPRGPLPICKIGRRSVYALADLREYLASCRRATPTAE